MFISIINNFASLKTTTKCANFQYNKFTNIQETRISVCADVRLAQVIYNRNTIQLYKIYTIFPTSISELWKIMRTVYFMHVQ